MSDFLSLKLDIDDDGTGELIARIQANGFSGRGAAWFNLREISDFASNLTQFPLPVSNRPTLRGGNWSKSRPSVIEQEHVGLEVYPIGSRGVIGVRARLATPHQNTDRPEDFFQVVAELKTSYAELARFAKALSALVSGHVNEALLCAEEI